MSAAREEILARVRKALADVPADEAATSEAPAAYSIAGGLSRSELADRFAERASEYRANVRRVDRGGIREAVEQVLAEHGARCVAVPAGLPETWRPGAVNVLEDSASHDPTELDAVDGALTGCALAIAETGTIILDSDREQGRRALTLVPDLHVCVVYTERIVGSVPEAVRVLEEGARGDRRPLTLISGPSATSDIELSRVDGVHGPRRLEIIVGG